MRDLDPQLAYLRSVEGRILLAEVNVAAQRGIVDRLSAAGHPAQLAVELLDLMRASLDLLKDHQLLLLSELAKFGMKGDDVPLRAPRQGQIVEGVEFEIRIGRRVVTCFVSDKALHACFGEQADKPMQCFLGNEWLLVCTGTRRALKSTGSMVIVTADAVEFERRMRP